MYIIKKVILSTLVLPFLFTSVTSCNRSGTSYIETVAVEPDEKHKAFCNVQLAVTRDELVRAGFNYGDVVKVTVKEVEYVDESGKTSIEDYEDELVYVSNYNDVGTYCPCLCNYEGGPTEIANQLNKLHYAKDCAKGKKVIIELKERGSMIETIKCLNIATKLSYEECGGDNLVFSNIRDVVTMGNIYNHMKPGVLYRGSSPFNPKANPDGRDFIADVTLSEYDINSEINLSVAEGASIKKLMDEVQDRYCYSFYSRSYDTKTGKKLEFGTNEFITKGLGSNFFRDQGQEDMKAILEYIINRYNQFKEEGSKPVFYLHCNEGKDRTGFFILLLEMLCGCSVNDLEEDFMVTFRNYYNISKINDERRYSTIANFIYYRMLYSLIVPAKSNIDRANIVGKINYKFDAKKACEDIISKHTEKGFLKLCACKYLEEIGLSTNQILTIQDCFSRNN